MLYVSKIRAARLASAALLLIVCAAPAFAQPPARPGAKKDDGIVIDVDGILRLIGDPQAAPPAAAKQSDGIILRIAGEPDKVPATDAEKMRAELKALEALLQQRLAESQKLKADIAAALAKMKAAEAPKEVTSGRIVLRFDDGQGADEIVLRKVDGKWTIVPATPKEGFFRAIELPAGVAPVPPPPEKPILRPQARTPDPKAVPADANQRIDNLEKKLDKVMEALEKMHKEMDGSRKKVSAEEEQRARAEEALRAAEKALKDAKPLEFKLELEKPR